MSKMTPGRQKQTKNKTKKQRNKKSSNNWLTLSLKSRCIPFNTHTHKHSSSAEESAVKFCTMTWLLVELMGQTRQWRPFFPPATGPAELFSNTVRLQGSTPDVPQIITPPQPGVYWARGTRYQQEGTLCRGFLVLSKLWGPSLENLDRNFREIWALLQV